MLHVVRNEIQNYRYCYLLILCVTCEIYGLRLDVRCESLRFCHINIQTHICVLAYYKNWIFFFLIFCTI